MSACVVAIGAISGLGRGERAYAAGPVGAPAPDAIAHDPSLAAAGLSRPTSVRASLPVGRGDRAARLLGDAFAQLREQLDDVMPDWRARRVGVCIGTSSGGMSAAERLFDALAENDVVTAEVARAATYFAPLDVMDVVPHKRCQVVAACASSTIAIGLGMRWLERDACDLVIAGGYDDVSLFVAAGFEALRATSASRPQPFRSGRDGMVLGEGAGLVAMVRDVAAPTFVVSGFGTSADAVHITAPDREGAGLVRAASAALTDAGCPAARIDLVSAHGTATPFNDAAEATAVATLFGERAPVVHPFKAQIGHTLGAAGVLEVLAAAHALRHQLAPAAGGDAPIDPDARVSLLERAESRPLRAALKLSAAFGGVTASLVVERDHRPGRQRSPRPVHLVGWATTDDVDRQLLAAATGVARDRLARIDDLGQLAIAAVAALVSDVGRDAIDGAGVVAGYGLATLDTNWRFYQRLVDKGPRRVEPRLFPATSPNAGAGHCAIVYGLTGPNFATNGGLGGAIEALTAAAELVASGDTDRMLVVAADDDGPAAQRWLQVVAPGRPHRRGAVAALIAVGSGSREVPLDLEPPHDHGPVGQLALRAFLSSS